MEVGDIVVSVCGHDIGEWYIVSNYLNSYVYLIDGKSKTPDNPKLKKYKHVIKTQFSAKDLAEKIKQKQPIQNAEIRKTLKFFKNND